MLRPQTTHPAWARAGGMSSCRRETAEGCTEGCAHHFLPAPSWPFLKSAGRTRQAQRCTHTPAPDRGDTCHGGEGSPPRPGAATDGNSIISIWGPTPKGRRVPGGRAPGRLPETGVPARATPSSPRGAAGPGSPTFPSLPPSLPGGRASGAGASGAAARPGSPPRARLSGARRRPGEGPGRAAFRPGRGDTHPTLRGRGSVLFGRAEPPPPHAAGEARAPRPQIGRAHV